MMIALKDIMHKENTNAMNDAIQQFKNTFRDQHEFLNYFQQQWEPLHIIQRWAYSYVDPIQQVHLTNNFIELWHNQLKVIYLKHICNKKHNIIHHFDHLIFILTNEVEFYFQQEHAQILGNSGHIGPLENQLSSH
ncbi:hypothetical protein BDA99DRAFT_449403 [Phascolomyces articulosus]|uniref:Uncharacterized protein n=1 Tax=Phascolomyces articulosus TaxID=60185 RepID=A0AAD5JWH5_9FUNG|nr:hypothetical protein BDA99DRAFT_449403 [Phascolomyces articulosus]